MIAGLLSEGVWALRDARGASEQRRQLGLERDQFVRCMLVGGFVTFAGVLVPELSGISAAMDTAMGDEPSDLMLSWPMPLALGASIAIVTALVIWKGPNLTEWLARRFGSQASLMDAAIWLYLATAAATVVALAIAAFDLVAGLASSALPASIGQIALAVALVSLVVSLAISAVLAQHLLGLAGRLRSLAFTTVWLAGCLAAGLAMLMPLYALLGGEFS
jgi:hypothetical protein